MVRAAIGRVQPHRTLRLLGAADANGDGRIDYLELAAFVATATGDVVNPNMRPHVFARGPGGHDEIAIVDTLGRSGARMLRMADNTASRKTMTTTGAAVLGLGTLSIAVGVFALARPWAGERLAIDYALRSDKAETPREHSRSQTTRFTI